MRFHRLVVENLNSFYGSHVLDFDREVGGAAVFLIVGPTGAGKSTLLDAISLALFGQTPRLNRKTGDTARDVWHIISIGTAHASAELDFSMREADGTRTRYKATWTIRRAHGDPDGAPQRPERSLFRLGDSGEIELLVSDHRAKFFQPAFDEVLRNVEIDDFKRSIMLAQGEFSAFLHASDSEKASILERLTNTEIYRKIGSKAAKIKRGLEQDLRLKSERLGESATIDDIDVDALSLEVAALEKDVVASTETLEQLRQAVAWKKDLVRLERASSEAKSQLDSTQERLKGRAALYERLEVDRQLRVALEPLERLADLRISRADLQAQSKSTKARVQVLKDEKTGDLEQLAAGKKSLEACAKHEDERTPELENAEKILAVIQEQKRSLAAVQKDRDTAAGRAKILDELSTELAARVSALKDERVQLAKAIEGDRTGTFEALETLFKEALIPAFEQSRVRDEATREIESEREELKKRSEGKRQTHTQKRRRRAPLQRNVTRYEKKLAELTEGRPEAFRAGLDARLSVLAGKVESLGDASHHVGRITELEAERVRLHDETSVLKAELESLSLEEANTKLLESEQRQGVESQAGLLAANRRIALLADLRDRLVMGQPCPLCGSPLHPFCESDELDSMDSLALADQEKLEADLETTRARLRETNVRVQALAGKFVSRSTSLRHQEARLIAIGEELERSQKQFARCIEEAGYAPLEGFRLKDQSVLKSASTEAEEGRRALEVSLGAIDKVRGQLEVAIGKAQDFDAQEGADDADPLKTERERLDERFKQARQEAELARQRMMRRCADFEGSLHIWGVKGGVSSAAEAEGRLEEARKGHAELNALRGRREAISKTLVKLETEWVENDKQRLDARKIVEGLEGRVVQISGEVAVQEQAAESILDGGNPSQLRRDLKAAVASARSAVEAVNARLANRTKAEAQAVAQSDEVTRRLAQVDDSIALWTRSLKEVLAALDVSEAYVRERILEPDVRDELERERAALHERRAMCEQQWAGATEKIDAHTLDEPKFSKLEASDEVLAQTQEDVNGKVKQLGAQQQQLVRAIAAGKRHEELRLELAGIEAELDRWRAVADLIGVGDGAGFKLFAQTMNLQGLVDRANARLVNLHPRYALDVPDALAKPSLSFVIRDQYRSGRARPLSTLSGGETFLVSLALALALSDYRRIDFPVETLLLDEGFGTLDQDSLQMALSTLHRLHQDGSRQIGIISHVDSLRDMVETRVVIEKSGQGRSRIRVERGAEKGVRP